MKSTARIKNVKPVASGIPAFQIVNRCKQGRYEMHKEIIADPDRDALLIDARFEVDNSHDELAEIRNAVWFRYTDDAYGEHPDGRPFDGTGAGHGWPLLAGERAHYEIAHGNFQEADRLRKTMERQSSAGGLIPEQVWVLNDIRERELFNGSPTGSGMPLVWAHAEYISLLGSLRDKQVWNMPPEPVQRFQKEKRIAPFHIWTLKQQRKRIVHGKDLRIDLPACPWFAGAVITGGIRLRLRLRIPVWACITLF